MGKYSGKMLCMYLIIKLESSKEAVKRLSVLSSHNLKGS